MRYTLMVLFLLASGSAFADECQPVNPAAVIATALLRHPIVLSGPEALAFSAEARAAGLPVPEADMVFLFVSPEKLEAEFLEDSTRQIGTDCNWITKADSRFGRIIQNWAAKKK